MGTVKLHNAGRLEKGTVTGKRVATMTKKKIFFFSSGYKVIFEEIRKDYILTGFRPIPAYLCRLPFALMV